MALFLLLLLAAALSGTAAAIPRDDREHTLRWASAGLRPKAGPAPAPAGAARGARADDWREELSSFLEGVRTCYGLVGLSVAIGDETGLIYAEGFGKSDLATNTDYTPLTRQGIGSTSKAFTSLAVGILQDRGALSFDTPLKELVPEFKMSDSVAETQTTARDALGHRSGLPRHDVTWAFGSDFDLAGYSTNLDELAPNKPFRYAYEYNNLLYAATGHTVSAVSGVPFETFLENEIFSPLGMSNTSATYRNGIADGPVATPYFYVNNNIEPIKTAVNQNVDPIGPAGSIVSNVIDMTEWLYLHVSGGVTRSGDRVVSRTSVETTHAPQSILGIVGPVSLPAFPVSDTFETYCMGWITATYRGYRVVWHNGAVFGHAAWMAFLPDMKITIAILSNTQYGGLAVTADPLQLMHWHAIDLVLGLPVWLNVDSACSFPCDFLECLTTPASLAPKKEIFEQKASSTTHTAVEEYVGIYRHMYYGDVQVVAQQENLIFSFQQIQGGLRPVGTDSFVSIPAWPEYAEVCEEEGVLECVGLLSVNFQRNDANDVISLQLPLEAAFPYILFLRI